LLRNHSDAVSTEQPICREQNPSSAL